MKINHKILIITLLSIFSLKLFSQQTKEDAVYNKIAKTIVINNDGSVDYSYRKELKLISNRSFFRDYGETFIVYNPDFQTLKINESYTIMENGTKVITPENAFNEVLPSSCADCGRYNNIKEMVITHTALEYNSTIVLDYTIHSKPEFITHFMEIIRFAEFSPVKEYDVTVKVPENTVIYEKMLNLRLGATITKEDGYKIYRWNVKNIAQTISDYYLPDCDPVLLLSTFDEVPRAYFAFVNQDAFRVIDLPEGKAMIGELIKDKSTDLEKILTIRDYVVDYVKNNPINLKYLNYVVNTPNLVYKTQCGTEAEKALLLSCMLNTAGFEAIPAAFTKKAYDTKEAGINAIAFWGIRVMCNGGYYILSPVRKNMTSMDAEYTSYSMYFISPTVETFKAAGIDNEVDTDISMYGKYNINNEGNAEGAVHCTIQSAHLPVISFAQDESKVIEVVSNIGGNVENINIDGQKVSFDVNLDKGSVNDNRKGYYNMLLPESKYHFSVDPSHLVSNRLTYVSCEKSTENYEYEVEIPSSYNFIGKNVNINVEKIFGNVNISIIYNKNKIILKRHIEIKTDKILLEDYDDFRDMMILWNNDNYKRIYFKIRDKIITK